MAKELRKVVLVKVSRGGEGEETFTLADRQTGQFITDAVSEGRMRKYLLSHKQSLDRVDACFAGARSRYEKEHAVIPLPEEGGAS